MRDRDPFGQAACEAEVASLKTEYSNLYFHETPFTEAALRPETYLIVGRRGSGKTALTEYFSFQTDLANPLCVAMDKPEAYQELLSDIAGRASDSPLIAIPRLKRVWEYVLWSVLAECVRRQQSCQGSHLSDDAVTDRVSNILWRMLDSSLLGKMLKGKGEDSASTARSPAGIGNGDVEAIKDQVLQIARKRPIIVTVDTLEQYDTTNAGLMNAMAALIEFASDFNLTYLPRGIHLKVFMSGEVLPHLQVRVLSNTSKYLRHPVYLLWRPKDLLRLICWRLYHHLKLKGCLRPESEGDIDWTDHRDVKRKMWVPYFGEYLVNARKVQEETFIYVLRHTQMRPRQLILLCNSIAAQSQQSDRFPTFLEDDIRRGILMEEEHLAIEIVNSFQSIYPHVDEIIKALRGVPKIFRGNILDKKATVSASRWPRGTYEQSAFKRLVTELGIVGRVTRNHSEDGYIYAEFEYSLRNDLTISHDDECVVHPMFYQWLAVEMNSDARVLPFSTDRERTDDEVAIV
jgi:hypothetical protein